MISRGRTPSLPEQASRRLFGRTVDLKRAEEALAQARLVTITGTAGVGKTRLAREILGRRVDPSLFVDTTEARGVEALCGAMARALGLGHQGIADASIQALGEALAARGRVLVVLDNFEQHVALAPVIIAPWLEAAPDADFLVTSRERLHLDGEIVCDLRPLPTPALSAPLDEITRCDAVQLFVARAKAACAGVEPAAQDLDVIAAIVRRLDGVPLAIELAAARADVLGPAQILARLSRPLDLLAAPSRSAPSRGTTLRAAIACSWDLLESEERRALVECSVFRGGFTLDAAEEVLGPGDTPVVDLVQALARKSLLHAAPVREAPRHVRLAMFESVRAFVAEIAPPPRAAEERHTGYYLRLGEAAARELRAARSRAPLAVLSAEHQNLIAVLERAERDAAAGVGAGSSALAAVRALAAVGPAIWLGTAPEAWIPRLDAVLASLESHGAAGAARAKVLLLRAHAAKLAGRPPDAASDAGAALALARREQDPVLEAEALFETSALAQLAGRDAASDLDRARTLARAHGEHALAAVIEGHAGWARFLARPLSAQDAFDGVGVGLRSAQAIGDRSSEARHRAWLGVLLACLGRSGSGRSELESAAQIAREVGDRALQVECLVQRSLLLLDGGDTAGARSARDEAAALSGQQTGSADRGALLVQDGRIALVLGRPGDAEAALRAAIEALDDVAEGAVARCHLASLHADRDHLAEAEAELSLVAIRGSELVESVVRVAAAHLTLGRARAAEMRGDLPEAGGQRRALEATLRAVRPWSAPPAPPALRIAVQLLRRAVEGAPPARGALLLGPDAAWFRVSGAEPVVLERRRPLRQILALLSAERLARPGVASSLISLLRAGWPGERPSHESAKNRVHVAISTLRKLGLREMLISQEDGWLLDPSIAIVQRADARDAS